MRIVKKVLAVAFFIGLGSCLSNRKGVTNKKTKMLDSKKEYTMMVGDRQEKIWIDESAIVGIVSDEYIGLDGISEVLKELKLDWYTPPITEIPIGNYGEPTLVSFRILKRIDGVLISQNNSPELEKLRELYWDNFGPGVFYESGQVWGVLSNAITIQFQEGVSQSKIDEILKATNADKTMQIVGSQYRVEYPKSWGYKVIDEGKVLFKREEVHSVENLYRVINTRM